MTLNEALIPVVGWFFGEYYDDLTTDDRMIVDALVNKGLVTINPVSYLITTPPKV